MRRQNPQRRPSGPSDVPDPVGVRPRTCDALLKTALAEDAARHDITSRSVIPRSSRIKAAIIAKAPGRLAGIDVAARVFTQSGRRKVRRRGK